MTVCLFVKLSALTLTLLHSGPLAGYLISKVGVRGAAVSSVLLHITGLAVSSAAKQTWHVICSFSILSGEVTSIHFFVLPLYCLTSRLPTSF